MVNSSDFFSATNLTINTTTPFPPSNFTFFSTTATTTTTATTNTTTSPAASEDPTSWIYILLGVLCWIAIFVGCGFAWTQLCKAFYHTSNRCGACARTCRRNPGISWLVKTKFFQFYFGNDCCCCRENEEDSDDEPAGSTTADDSGPGVSGDRTTSNNDSIPSPSTNAPPPPYEVAVFMRRPCENSESDEQATVTVTLSSHTEAETLEQVS